MFLGLFIGVRKLSSFIGFSCSKARLPGFEYQVDVSGFRASSEIIGVRVTSSIYRGSELGVYLARFDAFD